MFAVSQLPVVRSEQVRTFFYTTESQEVKSEVLSISAICPRACQSRSSDVLHLKLMKFDEENFIPLLFSAAFVTCSLVNRTNNQRLGCPSAVSLLHPMDRSVPSFKGKCPTVWPFSSPHSIHLPISPPPSKLAKLLMERALA